MWSSVEAEKGCSQQFEMCVHILLIQPLCTGAKSGVKFTWCVRSHGFRKRKENQALGFFLVITRGSCYEHNIDAGMLSGVTTVSRSNSNVNIISQNSTLSAGHAKKKKNYTSTLSSPRFLTGAQNLQQKLALLHSETTTKPIVDLECTLGTGGSNSCIAWM